MKKGKWLLIGIGVATAIIFVLVLWAKTIWFEDGSYLVTKTINVDHVVRFEAAGGNIRFYVFTPPGPENAHVSCGLSAGENNSSLHCWKKNIYAPEPVVGAKD